jgi:sterol desaturase/sphingolipid hydroxylase (fatty acid hydroxylase superfamily)
VFETAITLGLWPSVVVADVVLVALGIRLGHDPAAVLFAVNVVTLGTVLAAEQLAPHRREWSAFTDRQSLNDIGHGILQSQVGERLGELLLLTLAAGAGSWLAVLVHRPSWPIEWPMPLQILLGLVVADGLDYWKHRALHTTWGWRLHGLHHGITRLHALRSARSHFAEVVMRFLLVYVPLVALGAPREVLFWHAALIATLGVIGHSNVRLRVASPVHRLLMTPHVHRLHHSNDRAVADTNFANVLPVWDIVFGTFSHPDEHALRGVGVVGDDVPTSFLRQLLHPLA